jgi:AraC family ethanolamine operon transcriptional activator
MFKKRAHESQGPRIAREVRQALKERLDDPPSITDLCVAVGARERTLHPNCVEAFGRPPAAPIAELRPNAAYRRQFGELPSSTLARARGG